MNDNGKPNGAAVVIPPGVVEADIVLITIAVVNTTRGSIALEAKAGPGKVMVEKASLDAVLASKPAFANPVGAAHVELELLDKMQADTSDKPKIFRAVQMPRGIQ